MKMMPIKAANASSVNLVKYLKEKAYHQCCPSNDYHVIFLLDDGGEVKGYYKQAEEAGPQTNPEPEGHVVDPIRAI